MSLMPSCKDITEHASDYLDHKLPWWKRPGYWLHMLMCVHCRRYLEQLKLTISAIGKSPGASPPNVSTEQVRDIVKHIQEQTKQ